MKKNKLEKVAERLSERLQNSQYVIVKMAYDGVKAVSSSKHIASGWWVKEVMETAEEFKMNFYVYQDMTNDYYCAMIHEF